MGKGREEVWGRGRGCSKHTPVLRTSGCRPAQRHPRGW